MKKIETLFYILSFSLLLSQGQKIGYVNMQYIYAQNEDARLVHADVEKEAKRLQVEYESKAIYLDSLMKDYQKSIDDIRIVLDLEPRHFGALSGRAQIYIDLELYQKALKDLKDAKKIHPVIRGNSLINELEKIVNGQNV